jgi:hypothetical protein
MRSNACASLALVFTLAACGGGKPAEEPQNTEESPSESASAAPASSSDPAALGEPPPSSSKPPSSTTKVGGDDADKVVTPCSGFSFPDLLSVISQTSCEAPDTKAMQDMKEMKDVLGVKVEVDSPFVAPGSNLTVKVTYTNKGKVDLPLYWVVDPEPRFELQAYTLKGARADNPPGSAPSLPPEVNNAPPPDQKVSKVTLVPNGTATLTLKWDAIKYKWASKERAKGAVPGRGYPREPSGPLKTGKYVLRVVTPMTGVMEGVDKEVSQPRVQVTVGGMGGKH